MGAIKTTVADIEPLIAETKGNVAVIARKLGVSRGTIWNRCTESPTLMQALEDARESMIDNAESMLYKKVLSGEDTTALIFFLKTQGRRRGYVERVEQTGADGGPIEYKDVTELSDEELTRIAATGRRGITDQAQGTG